MSIHLALVQYPDGSDYGTTLFEENSKTISTAWITEEFVDKLEKIDAFRDYEVYESIGSKYLVRAIMDRALDEVLSLLSEEITIEARTVTESISSEKISKLRMLTTLHQLVTLRKTQFGYPYLALLQLG